MTAPPRIGSAARWGCAALLGLAAGAPRPAAASEVAAVYQAYWAGLPAGEIRLGLREGAGLYRDKIAIRSTGLPWLVTRFRGTAVSGGRDPGSRPVPSRYEALYDLRKRRDKRLSMVFDNRGGRRVAERGAGDSSEKPPLAERFRSDVIDPLSVLTAIRDELRRGNRGSFAVSVYDGSRRFDVRARVLPAHAGDRVLRLELTLAPLAGFKGGSSDDGDPDDAPRPVTLTVSNDARLMPLTMRVSVYYLPLVVNLSRWCESASRCGL
jgi:hypothetical protein